MFKRVMPWFWILYGCIRYPEASPFILGGAALVIAIRMMIQRRRSRVALAAHVPDPAESAGILFLESGEPLPSDSRCITCRHPLARDVIYCVQCHTPHHRDCFRYVGACSVYACRNRAA